MSVNSSDSKPRWDEFEKELSNHDWYYHYSEDHRIWERGCNAARVLERMRGNLSYVNQRAVAAMWNKYAPSEMQMKLMTWRMVEE